MASAARTLSVVPVPDGGEYLRSLYGAMPPGVVRERVLGAVLYPWSTDVLHVHVPERLKLRPGLDPGSYERVYLGFIEAVARSRTRVVWTVHNRRPHRERPGWGRRLYGAWARTADALIHHSRWGEERARAELPFPPAARHFVIPHGHFGPLREGGRTREALERDMGLPRCALRFGVLGQPLPAKRVAMVMRAFARAAPADRQLLVTALRPGEPVPADPRIVALPWRGWRPGDVVSEHLRLCDVLVCAHTDDTYLTSGQVGDAVGVGLPVVASLGFFAEALGSAAFTFAGTEAGLAHRFATLDAGDVARGKEAAAALRGRCDWSDVARRTVEVYRTVVGAA